MPFTRHEGRPPVRLLHSRKLLTVAALLETGELKSAEEVKRSLNGNICRCTGYRGIVDAVCELAGVPT